MLKYLREYRTYAHIAASYGIDESNIYHAIKWVEDVLIKDGMFSLPGRRELLKSEAEYEVILIDATETSIEHPQKNRESIIPERKKHTLKTQLVTDRKTLKIICLNFSNGKRHNLRLFKESNIHTMQDVKIETETGYVGIKAVHKNSYHPKKRSKNNPLTKEDKVWNHEISKDRIYVEHTIRLVKRFRIVAEGYRNCTKRFDLRFSLIAGICNFELND